MINKGLLLKLLPLLVLLLAASAFAYMKSTRPERIKPEPREKVWQVDVMAAEPKNLSPLLTLYGEVETPSLLRSAAPGVGQISAVLVKPGDRVSAGQKLLEMDGRDFAATLQQSRANVADLEAQLNELALQHQSNQRKLKQEKKLLELSQQELQRVQRLKKNNLSSESALNKAREALARQELSLIAIQLAVDSFASNNRQLKARLDSARAKLSESELAVMRSEVIAPFDGFVSQVSVSSGDQVNKSEILLSLYAMDSMEIRARIPSTYQAEIARALETQTQLMAQAELSGDSIMLELSRLAGSATPGGIDAYFRVTQGVERLRIGNLLKINLQRPVQNNVIAVPFSAIYGNNRIFILQQGRMKALDVKSVGQYMDESDKIWVLLQNTNIEPGTQVITTHLPNAVDGLKVKPMAKS
jgi:HlyD family secretion protein